MSGTAIRPANHATTRLPTQLPVRAQLIANGMVWSAARGDTAFTVPLFDRFMRRIMPADGWR